MVKSLLASVGRFGSNVAGVLRNLRDSKPLVKNQWKINEQKDLIENLKRDLETLERNLGTMTGERNVHRQMLCATVAKYGVGGGYVAMSASELARQRHSKVEFSEVADKVRLKLRHYRELKVTRAPGSKP